MVTETGLALRDGRTLHVYDTGSGDGTAGLAVFWQHGTPSTGAPPGPLFAAAAERGIRTAELWLRPDDGHVSVLDSSVEALDWLRERAGHRQPRTR